MENIFINSICKNLKKTKSLKKIKRTEKYWLVISTFKIYVKYESK